MYNVIYKIPFKNIKKEQFEVRILEDGAKKTPVVLTGGTPAFIVEYNDEDFLYTGTRFSGATLKLVGSDYLQSLFSTDYQKFKVNLYKGNKLLWTGFVTPEIYSQDYSNNLFELEIECISSMATLEYINFNYDKDKISFMEIIKKCITESKGDFNGVYIPKVYDVDLNQIYVSTGNFFDEEGESMCLSECLEEVCKFLNWSVTEYEGGVYFTDIDYIKSNKTLYTNILTNSDVNLSSKININTIQSKGSDDLLSVLGGYNQVTIVDSDYELDSEDLFPEISLSEQIDSKDIIMGSDGKQPNDESDVEKQNASTYKLRWYLSKDFDTHNYMFNGNTWITPPTISPYYAGSHVLNFTSFKNNDKPIKLNWQEMFEIKMKDHEFMLDGSAEPKDIDKYHPHPDVQKILKDDIGGWLKPTVKNSQKMKGIVSYPDNTYLGLNLSVCLVPKLDPDFRGIPIELNHKKDKIENILEGNFVLENLKEKDLERVYYVPARIKIGNKYWNGSAWVTSDNICKIPLDVKKDSHIEGKWISIKNTNSFEKGVEDLGECYLIPVDSSLYGKLEVEFYIPIMPARTKEYIYIKDIKIESERVNKSDDRKKEKQDTKYTNVVNEKFINPLDDIEFKITSYNNSNICYSKAVYQNHWLDTMYNNIFNTTEKPEELLIKRIVNQYKQPKYKLLRSIEPKIQSYSLITDKHLPNKTFINTGGQMDYESNTYECCLVEVS